MTTLLDPPASRRSGYHHEAFFWTGIEEFLGRTVPFVEEGLAEGAPVVVALTAPREAALRDALGTAASTVVFHDMTEFGHNPARLIPAWLDHLAAHRGTAVRLRGVGEPVWAGRRAPEIAECHIHEALLNVAIPHDAPLVLLCPYERDTLGAGVLDEVHRTHPTLTHHSGPRTNGAYAGDRHARTLWSHPLPSPASTPVELTVTRGSLAAARRLVVARARGAGLDHARAEDLRLAVTEVAANSLDHGGGGGTLRVWTEPGAFVFEVMDAGTLDDPLVGRSTPSTAQPRGRGLWLVNQLCDLMQIRSGARGTTVRVSTWT
ncbi:sensor histidine kinase [Sanguibacter suaedae]|uniref:Sensor histidine kinase n=1 Tax=Sanguibacter suaedae TaxID=2795737 RepID=A0A934IFU2_9MICO|nr:sensor histidine kinase [Sanguibacter suaedae]MBI9116214.1 sensor histidine kinase [Sanguibacter suaedae]